MKKYGYRGELLTLTELMPFSYVCRDTLRERLNNRWDIDKALTVRIKKYAKEGSAASAKKKRKVKIKMFAQCNFRCNAK